MNKVHFPNLNSLRLIAALLVLVHHVEQLKSLFGFKNHWTNTSIVLIGRLGVILFFVLSGFLITYLLLMEEKLAKTISIIDFYKRRILRIWPLYYLLIVFGIFILNNITIFRVPGLTEIVYKNIILKLVLFLLFFPNVVLFFIGPVAYVSQTWSVGVEEQFYLLWPWLMRKTKNKKVIFIWVIVIYLFIKIGCFFFTKTNFNYTYIAEFFIFWDHFNIDCMAVGGILAYLYFINSSVLKYFYLKASQIIIFSLTVLLVLFGQPLGLLGSELYGLLFSLIILNLATNKSCIINLEYKLLSYLGKVSYGLYMYHPIAIVFVLKLLILYKIDNDILQYVFSLLLTIVISVVSYELFEKRFIKMKFRFSKIISG